MVVLPRYIGIYLGYTLVYTVFAVLHEWEMTDFDSEKRWCKKNENSMRDTVYCKINGFLYRVVTSARMQI